MGVLIDAAASGLTTSLFCYLHLLPEISYLRKMSEEGRVENIGYHYDSQESDEICPGCSLSLEMLKPSDMMCPQCKDPYPRTPRLHRYMEKVHENIRVLYKRLRDEEIREL